MRFSPLQVYIWRLRQSQTLMVGTETVKMIKKKKSKFEVEWKEARWDQVQAEAMHKQKLPAQKTEHSVRKLVGRRKRMHRSRRFCNIHAIIHLAITLMLDLFICSVLQGIPWRIS